MATQPQKGPPIKVDVWAWREASDNSIQFDHDWQVHGNPTKHKGRIDIPKGQPATEIHFHLKDDETGLDLEFCTPASEAMYVGPAPNCPPPQGNGGQITYQNRTDKLLKVEDANSAAGLFMYALRFDGKPNPLGPVGQKSPPYVYDPELRNGGGTRVNAAMVAAITAGGAIIGAGAALAMDDAVAPTTVALGAVVGAVVGFIAARFLGGAG